MKVTKGIDGVTLTSETEEERALLIELAKRMVNPEGHIIRVLNLSTPVTECDSNPTAYLRLTLTALQFY